MTFVKAERELGHYSRLVTLGPNTQKREEDVCLQLPFLDSPLTRWAKQAVTPQERLHVSNQLIIPDPIPLQWKPGGWMERDLITLREKMWERKITATIRDLDFFSFDLMQLDGGMEFYRDGRLVRAFKEKKKKVICCYTGSDLRTRGVIPEIDRLSDLNVTVEIDHLLLHPHIVHVPFPLDLARFPFRAPSDTKPVLIGHAPTNRKAKGTDTIISVLEKMKGTYPVELVLIEGLPFDDAIAMKRRCHLFIDQIGDLGYGINAIEALAMGIPTLTSLAPGFKSLFPNFPFLEVDSHTMESILIQAVSSFAFRERKAREGRKWVEGVHDATSVVQRIHRLAEIA